MMRLPLEVLLDRTTKIVRARMKYPHCAIALMDEQYRLIYRAGYGLKPAAWFEPGQEIPPGIVRWVVEHGTPACVADVRQDSRYLRVRPQTRSELCVPLKTMRRVVGFINCESGVPAFFGVHDEQLLTLLANGLSGRIAQLLAPPAGVAPRSVLTTRESAVLELVAQGKSNKEIACTLGITCATVDFHLRNLYRKLGASSRIEAVVCASRFHLLPRGKRFAASCNAPRVSAPANSIAV
ncbi:MAG: GAF domain-containing protein [Chloroflexi bacterium]|nr:GAF domain-containing protein [Chloroflexota bacterium]